MLNNSFLDKYEKEIVNNAKEENSIEIARNFKDILSDEVIAERTGLPLEKVKQL